MQRSDISGWVDGALKSTPIFDLHTHLYPASFGRLMLWGIDELLTYHYLVAEVMRVNPISYAEFWELPKARQADLIWRELFVERAPISEACRGVVTVLNGLGLDTGRKNLREYREFFAGESAESYVDRIFKLANVKTVVMTNDPLDPVERGMWMEGRAVDERFRAVLRIDPVLLGWPKVIETLSGMGYRVSADVSGSMKEVRRFLGEWIDRMKAIYVAVSLPSGWRYPDSSAATHVLRDAVLPVCRERNLPMALMIGVARQVNPQLRLAGDSVGKADISSLERVCAEHPENKFMVTMLSRENQHELAVTARKFRNLYLFGCWWFLNTPGLIEEVTRMRVELLGTSFTPQHSDCRVLDQLLYKWEHSRVVIGKVIKEKFEELAGAGWKVSDEEVRRTVEGYLSDNFKRFLDS